MSIKFIEDLVTALASAGMGVNIIVVCPDDTTPDETDTPADDLSYEGIFGGGAGGGTPQDAILMDNPLQL